MDPAAFLEAAVRRLRAGGVISIWTPNGGAAGTDVRSAQEWVGFRVDLEDLQYLSPQAIVLLAGKLGLTVQHLETTGFPGLAGIDRPPAASWFRRRLEDARAMVSSSCIGPMARALRAVACHRGAQDRTAGTYHLFAVLAYSQGLVTSSDAQVYADCNRM